MSVLVGNHPQTALDESVSKHSKEIVKDDKSGRQDKVSRIVSADRWHNITK